MPGKLIWIMRGARCDVSPQPRAEIDAHAASHRRSTCDE
jgi:hypothetical protein